MDFTTQIDMDLVCRVCMQIDEEMFWIFEELGSETENNESVAEMLSECTMYRVERYDELPHLICGNCVREVRQAFRFKRECEESYRTMMGLLGHTPETKPNLSKSEKRAGVDISVQTEDRAVYPCDRCDQKFFTFDTLRVHRRVSHKANAIICEYCAKTFNRMPSLKAHMKKFHDIDDSVENLPSDEDCDKANTDSIEFTMRKIHTGGNSAGSKSNEEEFLIIKKDKLKAENDKENKKNIKDEEGEFISLPTRAQTEVDEFEYTNTSLNETQEYTRTVFYTENGDIVLEDGEEPSEQFMEVLIEESEDDKLSDEDEFKLGKEIEYDAERTSSAESNAEGEHSMKKNHGEGSPDKRKRGRPRKDRQNRDLPYKCTLCDKSFEQKVNLQRHQYHHNEVKQKRTCEECGKYFSNEEVLQRHVDRVHKSPKIIKCDECGEEFNLIKKFQRHKEKEHGTKFHKCNICQKSFRSKMYLACHMEKHNLKQFSCRECSLGFSTKEELNEHIKLQKHDKTMLCPECGLRCKTTHELTAHRRSHNGEKPFKCKFCSKAFARMDALGMHEKYHTDVKSHFCGTCGKGFHRAYNLRVHERVHTGEKPYQCPHCPQAFKQGNDLKAHVRRHTGERFRCDQCDAAFLQCYQMRQHKLNEHGIKEEAPTQRVAKFLSPEEQQEQINKQKELAKLSETDAKAEPEPEQTVAVPASETEGQQASDVLISIVWD